MTSDPHTNQNLSAADAHVPSARLSLKPDAAPTGHVDGAWWPQARSLTTELPDLLAELVSRIGPISRVSFALTAWDPLPTRRIPFQGYLVRLGGFHSLNEHVLDVIGDDGRRLTMLVIPPDYPPPAGEKALALAAEPSNTDAPAQILAAASAADDH